MSNTDKQGDVEGLMDAVGVSGVDISAEERLANDTNTAQAIYNSSALRDKSRKQDFIDPALLAETVKRIAASFQLKTLEPDTLPFIALAARRRLADVIAASAAARDHRVRASQFRAPPRVSHVRRRTGGDALSFLDDFDTVDEPAWDLVVHEDPARLLSTLERVDREDERARRRARSALETREHEEMVQAAARASPEALTPEDGKRKKKKRESAAHSEKHMSEDVRKRLTDQVALQSIGGRQFAWMTGGTGPGTGASPLPRRAGGAGGSGAATGAAASPRTTAGTPVPTTLASRAPASQLDAERREKDQKEWEQAHQCIAAEDVVFALDHDRGMGIGKGSGRYTLLKAGAGVTSFRE